MMTQPKVTGVQVGEGAFIYREDDKFVFCDSEGDEVRFKNIEHVRNALTILIANATS
jgi:hypothetical protein